MTTNRRKKCKSLDNGWIDISVPIKNGMPRWPGDPEVQITRISDMDRGDDDNLTYISMCAHTGTHMDAPLHFRKSGKPIDKMPLSAAIGKARVIEIRDKELITVEEIRPNRIRKGERILFKTGNSKRRWDNKPFMKKFVHLSTCAAEFLSERKVRTIGIDYLSIGGYEGNVVEVHNIILKSGIWVIEGLDFSKIKPGDYELNCLPIKLTGADGAPCRALIRKFQ
jgi:arylformamidase